MKKKLNIKPKRESNIPERNMMQDSVRMPKAGYGGTTGMGTVPMMMFEHGGKFGSYDNRDTGYYKQGGYIWQTTPHMKHGGMPAYGQSFPEANWWGYRSSGPSQFTLPYQLDIKLPPPPEREGPIPTYRNEINSTDYDAATFKAGGRVRMKFRGENHEIYQDGDAVYVNHPETRPGKDKGKWKKFNATKEVGAKTIGQAEHAIEEWHNANPGKYEFGGNVTTGQWAIIDDGENDLPEAGKGYIVKRSSDRKGKTHVVIGPDGTKKYFGDSKLGQHPKDPERKKAFYARHKKNLDNNPYFRAFARKTWEYGGEVTEDDIPMAKNGENIAPFYKDEEDKKRYQQALTDLYYGELNRNRGSVLPYLAKDRTKIFDKEKNEQVSNTRNTCIDGVCGIMEKAGKYWNSGDVNRHYIGNQTFFDNAYGSYNPSTKQKKSPTEDVYQATGNFQVGDIVQDGSQADDRFIPSDAKVIVAIEEDSDGNKIFHTSGGSGSESLGGSSYTEDHLRDLVKKKQRVVTRPGYQLDKEKLLAERNNNASPEDLKAIEEREKLWDWERNSGNLNWAYSLRDDAPDVNTDNKYVNAFMRFANDPILVEDLARKLNVSMSDVHDELLNTFGELGQESKFGEATTPETILERVLPGFIRKDLSIGPGQIRFSTLDPDLKKKLSIKKPKDLYNPDKLIPVMTGINLLNRAYLKRKGDTLGEDLAGVPDVNYKNIRGGIGRWTPYMYQSPKITGPKDYARRKLTDKNWIFNPTDEEVEEYYNENPRYFKRVMDPDSYASQVAGYIDRNLKRENMKGTSEFNPIELMEPVITPSPPTPFGKGGMIKIKKAQGGEKVRSRPTDLYQNSPINPNKTFFQQYLEAYPNRPATDTLFNNDPTRPPLDDLRYPNRSLEFERGREWYNDKKTNPVYNKIKSYQDDTYRNTSEEQRIKDLEKARRNTYYRITPDGYLPLLPQNVPTNEPSMEDLLKDKNFVPSSYPSLPTDVKSIPLVSMYGTRIKKASSGMRLDLNPLSVMPARTAGNGYGPINLHLPKYPDRKPQNLYANPYMFGLSPEKDVNVYGAGASFGLNFLDRGRNTFGATGNVNNTAVSYPGGFEISPDPYRSLGLRYVHRFQKGGMLPKAQTGTQPGYSWSTNTSQAPKQQVVNTENANIRVTGNQVVNPKVISRTAIQLMDKPVNESIESQFNYLGRIAKKNLDDYKDWRSYYITDQFTPTYYNSNQNVQNSQRKKLDIKKFQTAVEFPIYKKEEQEKYPSIVEEFGDQGETFRNVMFRDPSYSEYRKKFEPEEFNKLPAEWQNEVLSPDKMDTIRYLAGLQLLKESGNPYITQKESAANKERAEKNKNENIKFTSNFRPSYNRMYLEPYDESAFISELAHAQQLKEGWEEKPEIREQLFKDYEKEKKQRPELKFSDYYDNKYYDTPGSVEHDAHTIREPKLHERYNFLRDSLYEVYPHMSFKSDLRLKREQEKSKPFYQTGLDNIKYLKDKAEDLYYKTVYKDGGRIPIAQNGLTFREVNDNPLVQTAKMFDPTGFTSWPDAIFAGQDFYEKPSFGNAANFGINFVGALPMIGKFAMPAKLAMAARRAKSTSTGLSKGINAAVDTFPEIVENIALKKFTNARPLSKLTEATQNFTSKYVTTPIVNKTLTGGKQHQASQVLRANNNVDRVNLANTLADGLSVAESVKKYSNIPKAPLPGQSVQIQPEFKNGGRIFKAQKGTKTGYSWSTQQTPTQQVVGSAENPQTSKPAIQISLPEVEIVAKKTRYNPYVESMRDPNQQSDWDVPASEVASALFLAPIEEWGHTPSTAIHYGIGAYKNKDLAFNPYQSEITETLDLETDPNNLWHSVRNFAINNAADVLVPVEGIAQPSAKFFTNLGKGVAEGAEAYGKSLGATRQIIDNYRNRGQALFATPQTEELLKTVRNVGLSLKNEGDLYNPKIIESVLERAKSLSDSQFKGLTGFEKSELENRLKQLLSGELKKPEVPRVDGMTREEFVRQHLIDLRRPGRRQRLQELSLNIGEQNPQGWQTLDNTIQVPGDWDIDINRFASEPNMFLQYYENSPNIIDKLNTKLQQTLNKKLNLAEQTELSKESQALINGIFAREGEAAIRKKLIGAVKRVKGAKKGENFIPSSSLSTDSYPLSYKFLPNLVKEGEVELGYHGMKNLNPLGFSEQIGIPLETNLREINTVIENINKVSKKKFPYAVIKNNSIDVPVISATKLKLGGKISLKRNKPNTWQILD